MVRKMNLHYLLALLAIFTFSACEEDDDILTLPDTYDGSNFEANTSAEASARAALANLTAAAKTGRTPGTTVDGDNLLALYRVGIPDLESISTDYYAGRLTGADGWLQELAKASGGTYAPGEPTGEGGTYGGYLFDEHGLELEQLIEKGLFGAALYHHAIDLMRGDITPATVDQLVSIFGAHPSFPNTDNGSSTSTPDVYMAKYAARRDKNDGNGLYTRMRQTFIELQASALDDRYPVDQEEALNTLQTTWEQANAATIINYCHATISGLSNTNPTESQIGNALHAYSEAVGFLHGWRTLPDDYRLITDAEIDQLLVLLNAPHDAEPTSYRFATDPVNELPKLTEVIETLQGIYGFTEQQIEDFRMNWVSEQGR